MVFLSLNSMHHHRKMVEVGKGRAEERLYRLTKAALKARNGKPEREPKATSKKATATKKPPKPATKKHASTKTMKPKAATPASATPMTSDEIKS